MYTFVEVGLTLSELADRSGTPQRTIRLYIARELLLGTSDRGPGASYPDENLDRLRFIQRLRTEFGLGLGSIRGVIEKLDRDSIRRVGSGEEEVIALPISGQRRSPQSTAHRPEKEAMVQVPHHSETHRDNSQTPVELKKLGLAEIERIIADALGRACGEQYSVSVDRIDFRSRSFGSRPGAVQIAIEIGRAAEDDRA